MRACRNREDCLLARLCRQCCWAIRTRFHGPLDNETLALRERFVELNGSYDGLLLLPPRYCFRQYFRLSDPLGAGGFGSVFRAKPKDLALQQLPGFEEGCEYAVKRIKLPRRSAEIEEIERSFLLVSSGRHVEFFNAVRDIRAREAFMVRTIVHVVEVPNTIYFVMDLLTGPDMMDWIWDLRKAPTAEQSAEMTKQMLTALEYLHRVAGALHRDVKLENFGFQCPVNRDNPHAPLPPLKLFDLGLVWVLPELITEATASTLHTLRCVGTTPWIAPEVWRGQCGPASDLWGVGLMLHILLTLEMPFGLARCKRVEEAPKLLRKRLELGRFPTMPPLARQLLEKMLAKKPADRPTTQEALRHEWLNFTSEQHGSAAADGPSTASSSPVADPTSEVDGTGMGLVPGSMMIANGNNTNNTNKSSSGESGDSPSASPMEGDDSGLHQSVIADLAVPGPADNSQGYSNSHLPLMLPARSARQSGAFWSSVAVASCSSVM